MPPRRSQQKLVEQHAKELEDYRRMLDADGQGAFAAVLSKMEANADAADYLEPASPRLGMDWSLYIEAELERQELREQVEELEEELDQLKEYLASKEISTEVV